MGKVLAGITMMLVLLGHLPPLWALNAGDIKAYKTPDGKALNIVVRNRSGEPRDDYVKSITVTIDDEEPVVQQYRFQRGPSQRMIVPVENFEEIATIVIAADVSRGYGAQITIDAAQLEMQYAESSSPEETANPEAGSW